MSLKLTTESFIEKAKTVHSCKYNYSKVNYINSHTKVCIICPEHGEFLQMPYSHLQGYGCNKCGRISTCNKNKNSLHDFILKANIIHNNKYDYTKTEYVNNTNKVCIICSEHGEFHQRPHDHLKGCGCPKCAGVFKSNTNDFINKAKEIHGNKYDYSKVEYVNARTKVCVICPEHGKFWITPNSHLCGEGCKYCNKPIHNTDSFITEAKKVHGDKYDYSKVKYVNYNTKVCIICPEHGEFWQSTSDHLKTNGCAKCGGVAKYSTEEFIMRAKEVHGDRYDYSKVEYKGSFEKVCIICPKHGEFWQNASSHINLGYNCPICRESKLETDIAKLLDENNVKYERQKYFKWLGKQSLDFYLPDYNVAIECQGIQHFEPVDYFGGGEHFEYVKRLDEMKYQLCIDNNVKLLYYANVENIIIDNYIIYNKENLFSNKQVLIESINNVKIY